MAAPMPAAAPVTTAFFWPVSIWTCLLDLFYSRPCLTINDGRCQGKRGRPFIPCFGRRGPERPHRIPDCPIRGGLEATDPLR
jgi:hypothetical protein